MGRHCDSSGVLVFLKSLKIRAVHLTNHVLDKFAQAIAYEMLSDDAKYVMLEALEGEPHRDAAAERSQGTSTAGEEVTTPESFS